MPTLLDNTLKSKNMVLAFGGVVVAATAWMLAGDLFPPDEDPKGDPETWTREEMRRWLEARSLFPKSSDTREELLARVQANLRVPRK
ncbi:Stress-responsive protein Ish1 [Cordyceps fumosorosea ARSEF 2679]|uniref:Stress-responsive protein Ish1 n=1 Tax=Cordyceps fumosorosea (strain ARSEF 2679) TaxID=1081104 RepID=A0A167P991_CORFA|nr:Stress-responsive protein Ish1 [Cordyceps fumosorosea ARSEF 2679]OAA56419.1 Stress-responsive protein Ish1 [Cordyceps fumosorosea ARSEF 2679]